MRDGWARIAGVRGIHGTVSAAVAILVMTLCTVGVVVTAVTFAYAESQEDGPEYAVTAVPAISNSITGSSAAIAASAIEEHGTEPNTPNLQTTEPGVTVSSVSLAFPEGMNAVYDVVLDAAPSDDVTIEITADSNADVTVDPASLTFTTGDWRDPKSVTVTGMADADTLTDRETIAHMVSGGGYDDIEVEDVQVFVTETCDALWCGIMEVEKVQPHELQMVGLDNTSFMDGGQAHQVGWAVLTTRILPGEETSPPFSIPERASLRFWLTDGLAGTGYYSNWTMYVNDVELPFSEARVVFDDLDSNTRLLFRWYAPGLNGLFPIGHGAQGHPGT